jgi:hypothetical protein
MAENTVDEFFYCFSLLFTDEVTAGILYKIFHTLYKIVHSFYKIFSRT